LCEFKNEFCRKCNKLGHIAYVCLSNKQENKLFRPKEPQLNQIDTDESEDNTFHEINIIGSARSNDKFMIDVSIEEKSLSMELDTGAALSSISYNDFKSLGLHDKRLFKTGVEMKTYTGEIIKPMGVAFVNCQYRNYNFHGKKYVLRQRVEPIFGREWLREVKMDWADTKQVELESSKQLDELLSAYKEIFKPEIGLIPTEKGHIGYS